MKFGNIGFIKIYCNHDLSSSGFTIKPKVYGPSLRSAVYRRPKFTHADLKFKYRNFLVLKEQESLELEKIFNYAGRNYQMSLNENL